MKNRKQFDAAQFLAPCCMRCNATVRATAMRARHVTVMHSVAGSPFKIETLACRQREVRCRILLSTAA
jgi:hypothetical protein